MSAKRSIAGGKPVQWSGKFRTGRIETIHTAAEAFFCSYTGGEDTLGQREPFKAVLQRDFLGPNARVRRIDDAMAAEHPSLSGV